MQEIPWEKTVNGLHAQRERMKTLRPTNLFILMSMATKKMQDLRYLSAGFADGWVHFEPYCDVMYLNDTHIEFFGIYQLCFERDLEGMPEGATLPDYCIRRALWDQEKDIPQYKEAQNKKEYMKGGEQIDATNVFISSHDYPGILNLVEELKSFIQHGIPFEVVQRDAPLWDGIQLRLSDEMIDMKLYYSLRIQQSRILELWFMRWNELFSKVDYTGGIIPEKNLRVSYQLSLEERLELFPE